MKKILAIFPAILPTISFAHEGHGTTDGYSIIHYFKEPDHLALTAIVLAIVLFFVSKIPRKAKQKDV